MTENKLFIFQEKNQKLTLKQTFETSDMWAYFLLKDLNFDGIPELICSSPHNMNGNTWSDIYSYNFMKDTFVLSAEKLCCINGVSQPNGLEKNYKSNTKYYMTFYGGSWYMPVTTSIYAWENQKLVLKIIYGTELLNKSITKNDCKIFFVAKNINDQLKITKQINIDAGENYKKEAEKIKKQIFDEYFTQ